MPFRRALPVLLLLSLVPGGARAAEPNDSPSLFIPVEHMRLVLVGPDERVVGSLQFDMTIEAKDLPARERISLLIPRIRDAILTRLPAQAVTERTMSSAQLQDAKRQIMRLIDVIVGKATAVDIQVVKSYIRPA